MRSLTVECRPGESGPVPARFGRPGAMRSVDEFLDHWPGDGHTYFKVRCDGAIFILRHDERTHDWQLHFFSDEGGRR
jgi:hypothetical protein